MICPRFAAPVFALLTIALVPTINHSYRGSRLDDGMRAAQLPPTLEGFTSSATARRPEWVRNNFDTDDWIERTFIIEGADVTLFVARSYDAKRLYHHPELALLRGTQTQPEGVVRSRERPDVPLHVITTTRDTRRGVAVYALQYGGAYIENPVSFQLRTSVELLVTGRKPLTLFMASALTGDAERVDDAVATRLLLAAIAEFERRASGRAQPTD